MPTIRYSRRPFQRPETGATSSELDVLQEAPARIREAIKRRDAEVGEVQRQVLQDRDLTAEGQESRVQAAREQSFARLRATAEQVRVDVERARAVLESRARAALGAPATGVEALMGRQVKWGRVRELIEHGTDLGAIIADADDPEALHAIAEEIPTYAQLASLSPSTRDAILADVNGRLATLAGESAASRYGDHLEAEALAAEAVPMINRAANLAPGFSTGVDGGGLSAALAARQAGQEARARLGLSQSPSQFGDDVARRL